MNGNLIVEALRSTSVPPVVVAELSGNHRGELDHALALVDAAADSGAFPLYPSDAAGHPSSLYLVMSPPFFTKN